MTGHDPPAFATHPVLAGLPDAALDRLAPLVSVTDAAAGTWLGREGEPATEFHLLQRGSVALEIHAPGRPATRLETLGPGDLLGWSWLVPPHRWQFDALAVTPVQVFSVDASGLLELLAAEPAVGCPLLARLLPLAVQQLQATRFRLLDVYHHAGV